jgi:hypothetical protein
VVIALIVTPDGLPLACEVMAGNTSDKTTLRDFIKRIETQYGRARRTWVMDRGIPTEKVLAEMRASETRYNIWWARRADGSVGSSRIFWPSRGHRFVTLFRACRREGGGKTRRTGRRALYPGP